MKKASISLPSIYPDKLMKCIDYIEKYTKNIDYEIIIVGTENIKPVIEGHDRIKFILDTERKGNAIPHQKGIEASTGEYSVELGDDVYVTENWLSDMIKFLEINDNKLPLQGCFRLKNMSGEEIPQMYVDNKFLYALLGCMKTETLKKIGGWDRGYAHYFSDPDVSMRIWEAGGRVLVCPDAWVCLHIDDISEELKKERGCPQDEKLFYDYWGKTIRIGRMQKLEYWAKFQFIKDIKRRVKNLLKLQK